MTVGDALAELCKPARGIRLKNLWNASIAASRVHHDYSEKVEQELKPHIKQIKRYVSRKLRAVGVYPNYQGRGWITNYKDNGPELHLRATVYVGNLQIGITLNARSKKELDESLAAACAAIAEARKETSNNSDLKVLG